MNNEVYFTSKHEEAIKKYIVSTDRAERSTLYIKLIEPAFSEMVDKIIYTYRFTTLPNIDYLKEECKVWLITVIDKYDPDKGSKAFSYFSVITKNWFIHKVKNNTKRNKREVQYDEISKELEQESLKNEDGYLTRREDAEFWMFLFREIDQWDKILMRENERKIIGAIKTLFQNIDDLQIFNKKAIYLYIREITGLNTKQIVNNLNKIRKRYSTFKKKWENSDF